MTDQPVIEQRKGAVIGGWACTALGTLLMFGSLLTFLLYLPLFFAAFVLGIVAIAQRRLGHGIPILLLSVVIPPFVGLGLFATKVQETADDRQTPALDEVTA